ncbi:DNA cytosine methyltransferase [Isoptericola sp. S6320L]|uniref:DNA cytosine methyltransferase n=1 Tax=Isoptericola sp. S6320L TaxID=2926411 RepID=UPI001FF47A84|nr:DNA cytosine methyltransferase [Isoptericola sp. S6320L]MCK0116970.1 DNA cytosine methyltransferase [Isoptericola sp. S6320L]
MTVELNTVAAERTSVELFAGAGGLAQAVERAGFRPLLFNEWDRRAGETLEANGAKPRVELDRVPAPGEPTPLVVGDVRELDMRYLRTADVDVLAGGCPCQPFSLGGVHKGVEDERNGFPHMFRAAREVRPKVIMVENVRGLLRASFRPYFEYIQRELTLPFAERADDTTWVDHDASLRELIAAGHGPASERYDVVVTPVNAADYGVPQVRNRVVMVAFRSDLGVDLDVFRNAVRPTHSEAALNRSIRDGSYWERHGGVPAAIRDRVVASLPEAGQDDDLAPWITLRDAIAGIDGHPALPPIPPRFLDRKERGLGGFRDHIGWPGARVYPGHTPNVLDRPAKTVKAGVHGVPGGESVMLLDNGTHRYMSVRETARVMTFPDDWRLEGPRGEKMRQLGNAVPVKLGEVFARAIRQVLDQAGA